jgi:hypothetical protein
MNRWRTARSRYSPLPRSTPGSEDDALASPIKELPNKRREIERRTLTLAHGHLQRSNSRWGWVRSSGELSVGRGGRRRSNCCGGEPQGCRGSAWRPRCGTGGRRRGSQGVGAEGGRRRGCRGWRFAPLTDGGSSSAGATAEGGYASGRSRWGTAGERGRRRWWGVGGSSRGAAAEGVVGSDGSGKRNRRERWRVKMEEGKMTDRWRGAVRRGDDDNFSLFLVVG